MTRFKKNFITIDQNFKYFDCDSATRGVGLTEVIFSTLGNFIYLWTLFVKTTFIFRKSDGLLIVDVRYVCMSPKHDHKKDNGPHFLKVGIKNSLKNLASITSG